ncbi:uncharacterized protein Z518_10183 [Rhinocladiella mackenziei CBS 650.93]|uniref:Aldehyde dehydrogenase domain-containing protein n=1 Tax=Rhinocladiella mackenziei CBS 650.93 TaxID=1442369 RepID=A0A0D2FGJ2_9EURO|nr:uncharacterized protein Z518_10183 [Rhinocladiella mackenziei CBS 650.93]KIX01117.1 hypothetical protein Z518_10183 [Rhinocladiella mackenziei CBS 650.93]
MSTTSSSVSLDFSTFSNVIDGKLSSTGKKEFKVWARIPCAERQNPMQVFADAMAKVEDGFAQTLTQEQGKQQIHFAIFEMDFTVYTRRRAESG